MIRWGIIGPGIIAHQFAQDVHLTDNAVITSVLSRNADRARSFAEQYSIANAFDQQEGFLNSEIDAVYIATPHTLHAQNCVDVLNSGKAVLCEKPITVSPEELEIIMKTARENQTYLMEGMWTYFLPAIQKAREWIVEGRIGKLVHVKASFGYAEPFDPSDRKFDATLAGGSIFDLGIYPIAMAWLGFKQDPEHIHVYSTLAPNGVDYDVSAMFLYPHEGTAQLASSFRCKLHNWAFFYGEKGYIAIPDFWRARECFLYERDNIIDQFNDQRKGGGFEFQIEAVSQDILEGKLESEIVTHNDSIHFQKHLSLIRKTF